MSNDDHDSMDCIEAFRNVLARIDVLEAENDNLRKERDELRDERDGLERRMFQAISDLQGNQTPVDADVQDAPAETEAADDIPDVFHADPLCEYCHGKYFLPSPPGVNVDPGPLECPVCKWNYLRWRWAKDDKDKARRVEDVVAKKEKCPECGAGMADTVYQELNDDIDQVIGFDAPPVLTGEDARRFEEQDKEPLTPEQNDHLKECREIYKKHPVLSADEKFVLDSMDAIEKAAEMFSIALDELEGAGEKPTPVEREASDGLWDFVRHFRKEGEHEQEPIFWKTGEGE